MQHSAEIKPAQCCIKLVFYLTSKIYIKTFKTILHVSITRSSSGNIYCSSLKLYFKTFSELLRYVNFGAVAAYM